MASVNSTVIARVAAGLYDLQLGNASMTWALNAVDSFTYGGEVSALVQQLYNTDFKAAGNAALAAVIVKNVGITNDAAAVTYVTNQLNAAAGNEGAAIVAMLNGLAGITSGPYAAAAAAFNTQIKAATLYAQGVGTVDSPVNPASLVAAKTFNLTAATAAGADVMRLTGGQDVRIDMTNPANQITGLDLDGDGTIEFDGKERSVTGKAANFEIVDAYARNPLNHTDIANNFLGDIDYNGTSFKGDGVSTNGNIVLGGLGTDKIFAGVGNDFLAGGGVAQGREGMDWLSGGRNADFFFAQFSPLDRTDGASSVRIDAGNTADDTSAAVKQSDQDNDWLLLEGTDDDETITVWLNDDNVPAVNTVEVQVGGGSSQTVTLPPDTDSTAVNVEVRNGDGIVDGMGRVLTRSGKSMLIDDVENLDASGNLYGFLNNMNVEIGGRAMDSRDAAGNSNYGIGSSAQLRVHGSEAGNIVIGGWDNDYVEGNGGSDLLMGGNLQQFLETVPGGVTNVNMAGITNDGRDELYGGEDSDNIVFEADGGVIDGGSGDDTLWLTKYSLGTMTASQMTKDGRLRFDLTSENGITEGDGNEGGAGYGGADDGSTADQTNYATGESGKRVTVTNMESIDATGLGGIDYLASGANKPELKFTNQQNFKGYNGDLQLLGSQGDNGLYAGAGNDEIQGRGGDDDMMGGRGNDDFYFAIDNDFFIGGGVGEDGGDGVDVIRRKIDANGDDLWDTDADDEVVWGQDFGLDSDATIGESVLRVSIQKAGGNTAGTQLNQVVNNVSEIVTGVKVGSAFTAITLNTPAIKAATTYQGLTDAINAALDATPFGADLQATLQSDGFTIFIADAKGRELADAAAEVPGAGVSVNQIANTATQNTFVFGAPAVNVVQDRLIYKSWEDRSDNEGVNDNSVFGSTMSLGEDAYAEDLVVSFQADGTRIAEDQRYTIDFDNLTTQDRVTVSVNGVQYQLQVGIDLDGNSISNEQFVSTSNNSNQPTIQENFLGRLADFINNSFTDDDTVAGKVVASASGSMLTLTQAAYDGEETVFMRTPVVTIDNISGGQAATATVDNASQHEVLLYKFDGRDNKLNETNVLFWGQESVQRANLETSKAAGGALAGLDAVIIDGGADDLAAEVANSTKATIANNITTNSPLSGLNYTVHGDDLLMGGAGVDQITGGTGDDRVIGSVGSATAPALGATSGELADGGKNVYAVQVLGESKARVFVLNHWEARNPTLVADLAGLTISSITPVRDTESGTFLVNSSTTAGLQFRDTLQFQQEDFGANARFTVALDDFVISSGVVQTRNDGAGLVSVDADGNGVFESYTRFTNFENIRTVSGSGKAVAGSGQGNDTLDVTKLSSTTEGAGGVYYNLTNDGGAGEVKYSADAFITGTGLGTAAGDRPFAGDYESLVIKVDGVENVNSSTGNDLVRIDETEAAKNNTFSAGLGTDRIVYENDFGGGGLGQPTVTIRVNSGTDTDTVIMQGGRVGTLSTPTGGAVDTLIGVEYLAIAGDTATSVREDDTIDVTAMVAGAVVDYTNGEVRTSMTAGTGVQLVIENMVEMERVIADGNDVVIVADADVMNNNDRSDENDSTSSKPILFMTYNDFDQLVSSTSTARKSFAAQATDGQLTQVINQGQFSFSLSEVGTDADVDRVDYSNELGRIVVPVGQGVWTAPGALTNRAQYVVVDGDTDNNWSDSESRVDALWGVEEIVAARGQSIMDFTAVGQARQITFTYVAPSGNPAENQVVEQAIRIADGSGNTVPGLNAFIERYTYNNTTAPVSDATWNRIEGSDAAEVVIYQGSEDLVNAAGLDHRFTNDVLTLRGGNNEVRYSPLETSISASIGVVSEDATTTGTAEGLITANITFQDGKGVGAPSGTFLGGAHTITSHTSDNSTSAGSLKIEGSQDAEDSITFTNVSPKTFILGASPGVITVNIGTTASMVLTGFEFLADTASDDVYDIRAITSLAGLTLTDSAADHDAIRVANDSVNYNGSGVNTIDLDNISATVGGLNFEFDVLDLTALTGAVSGLTVNGGTNAAPVETDADEVADNTDEVVLGALSRVAVINDFESMVLTEASTAAGTSFTFNAALNTLTQGSTTITTSANVLSFNGLVLEQVTGIGAAVYGKSYVPAATTGVNVTVAGSASAQVHGGAGADTINGGPLADVIQGAAGNDTLSGGVGTETRTVQLDLSMDGAAGGTVIATFDGFSSALTTVTEGVEIAVGAGSNAVAAALAAKLQANLAAINTGATWSNGAQLVSVTANVNVLTFRFNAGADVLDAEAITVAAGGGDAGLIISGTSITEQGSNGGVDTFLFEATGAANGNDTINNVTAGATGDVFDFTAFLGGAANEVVGGVNFVTTGLNLTGAANLGIVFNKASLAAADIQTTVAAGKIAIENNSSAVVIVTADADGAADTTINNYLVYYVRDTDTGSGQTWSVVQVGTLTSSTEIGAADFTPVNFV